MKKLLFLGKGVLLLCLFATHFVQAQTVSTAYATQINATSQSAITLVATLPKLRRINIIITKDYYI